ncbi:MAG: 30S ribosomal protein S20 [Saprospiraceae bacterium]|nr:30S ribosomal protein S20 [Saprospiraceae bacterium]
MAHHASAKKRIRQSAARRLRARFYKRTARTAIKTLRSLTDQADATAFFPKVVSMIDKLAKRNSIHSNKAANLKSGLAKQIAALA